MSLPQMVKWYFPPLHIHETNLPLQNDETDDFFMAAKTRPSMDILPLQIQKKIISSSPEDSNSPEIGSLEGSFDAVSLGSVKPRRPHHPLALNRGFSGQFNLELGKLAMNNPAPAPEQAQQVCDNFSLSKQKR